MSSLDDKPSVSPPSKKPRLTGDGEGASGTASFHASNSEPQITESNVLISGLGGLGVEIAKNLCLGGVKSVTLHDTANTTSTDLSTQFYLRKDDIGKNRAQASKEQLLKLNPSFRVHVLTVPLTTEILKGFKVVVFADRVGNEETVRELSTFCHANNIRFILAETRGVFSRLFCDFGKDFKIYDSNGEPPITAKVSGITRGINALVSCSSDDSPHGLRVGDYVTFSEVTGMDELNGCDPMEITMTNPCTFTIGDTTKYQLYRTGGIAIQVKQIKTVDFKSFEDSISEPECVYNDFAKLGNTYQLHCGFRALDLFVERNKRLPRPWNEDDAVTILELASEVNQTLKTPLENLNEKLLRLFSFVSAGNLSPMNAFLGGVAAQEVMKGCSGKFNPIKQWLYFDAVECLPQFTMEEPWNINEHDFAPAEHRSDGQVAVFGKEFQEKLGNLKFLVGGAGAIGCELLKNFAMMGVGAGDNGEIIVTDMGLIEGPILNREFLFRSHDVGKVKAAAAAAAIKAMNHKVKVVPQQNFVELYMTQDISTDEFFERLDVMVNALDNLEARIYMDHRSACYRKPLLGCVTLGTKGNTQVVFPCLTESYGSSQNPSERQIPICNLDLPDYPYTIEHTLQWARDLFQGLFHDYAKCAAYYLIWPERFKTKIRGKPIEEAVADVNAVKKCLVDERPTTIKDCVIWARHLWEDTFRNQIQKILIDHPENERTSSRDFFWSLPKRSPTPLDFKRYLTCLISKEFVFSAANLRAEMYGIPQNRNSAVISLMANNVKVHDGAQVEPPNTSGSVDFSTLDSLLPPVDKLAGVRITPLLFGKNDDRNLHMDFVLAASHCKAQNYRIHTDDNHQMNLIAAEYVSSTASVLGGLLSMEVIKLASGTQNLNRYKNWFVNFAEPLLQFSAPVCIPEPLRPAGRTELCETVTPCRLNYRNHGIEILAISEPRPRLWPRVVFFGAQGGTHGLVIVRANGHETITIELTRPYRFTFDPTNPKGFIIKAATNKLELEFWFYDDKQVEKVEDIMTNLTKWGFVFSEPTGTSPGSNDGGSPSPEAGSSPSPLQKMGDMVDTVK